MLWFKNLMVYRLSRDIELRAEEMEKQLAELTFTPCGSQDMAKTGWVSPMGSHSDALTHTANGQIIICARKEEKILPSPVIKQALEAKIQKLEADQGRKLKKTEKDSLKDEVLHSLLPRAFSRFSQTMMWIDTVNGLIMVDCASAKKAEDTLALLRKTLGSLPVVPEGCKASALLGDKGCETNGYEQFNRIHFWKTPVAEGGKYVPYSRWTQDYIAIMGGR